jgi:hypothetical protein
MLMIGDAVLGLVQPKAHCLLWSGPGPFGEMARWFASRPGLVRAIAAAELAAGLWIALGQEPAVVPIAGPSCG